VGSVVEVAADAVLNCLGGSISVMAFDVSVPWWIECFRATISPITVLLEVLMTNRVPFSRWTIASIAHFLQMHRDALPTFSIAAIEVDPLPRFGIARAATPPSLPQPIPWHRQETC
jgi:hypothetical protein